MANLYKPTYTKADPKTGERITRRTRKWYAKYRDANGVLQKVPLCEDKSAAQVTLAEILRNVQRQMAGLIDPATEQLQRGVDSHIDEYETHLKANARSEKHIGETTRIIRNIVSECKYRILADLESGSDRLEAYLAERREIGSSHRTINADLGAVRQFCRWLLDRKRMRSDPTAGMTKLNEEEDRRRERRPLTEEESRLLIRNTFHSDRVFRKLNGEDRAILYLLAQRSGLRRSELRSLTPNSFDFSTEPAIVRLAASKSKRRKNDSLPLPADVAEALKEYLDGRDPKERLWATGWWRRSAEMLHRDLKDIGISPVDAKGKVIDFHGQRMTYITDLARAGISPAIAQKLARHSDVNLTMGIYTKFDVGELGAAVETLPHLSPHEAAAPETANTDTPQFPSQDWTDPNLASVVEAWPNLSEAIRQAVVTLVSVCQTEKK